MLLYMNSTQKNKALGSLNLCAETLFVKITRACCYSPRTKQGRQGLVTQRNHHQQAKAALGAGNSRFNIQQGDVHLRRQRVESGPII